MKASIETQIHSALRSYVGGDDQVALPFTLDPKRTETHNGYIPTGWPELDSLVVAAGPAVSYNAASAPEFAIEGFPEDVTNADGVYTVPGRIEFPYPDQFASPEGYAHAVAHELTHWTQPAARANRRAGGMTQVDRFRSLFGTTPALQLYAREEVTAEIGGALLLDAVGIQPDIQMTASYVGGWLQTFEDKDERENALVDAELLAESAASWLLARVGKTLA